MVRGFLHELCTNLVGMTLAPIFQLRALDPLVEGTQGWATVHLEVDPLLQVPGQGQIHGVDEVPAEDQGHFVLRVAFRPVDFCGHEREVVVSGFRVDLLEAPPEVLFLDVLCRGASMAARPSCSRQRL